MRSCRWMAAALILLLATATGRVLAQDSTAAAGTSSSAVTPGYSWLRISAFVNVPLAGADVAVYDAAGNRIFQQGDATNDEGVFPAHIKNLPRNFRVTVTFDGEAQEDAGLASLGRFQLTADAGNFDPEKDILVVNPATTLASMVMDRLPEHDPQRAEMLVRRFLGLPPHYNLGEALLQNPYYECPYFSEAVFLQQAQQDGGLEPFLHELAPQMMAPKFPMHSFAGPPRAAASSPAQVIGLGLAYGALGWLGGEGIGWVMQSGGLVTPGATKKDIEQLAQKLDALQASVDGLKSQLVELNNEVKAQLTKIQFDLINVQALPLASKVNDVQAEVAYYAKACPSIVENDDSSNGQRFDDSCANQKKTIEGFLNNVDIYTSFGTLSTYLLDNRPAAFDGMIHLYSQALGQTVRFFRPADSAKMQDMFDFWYGAQTQAANLKVELLHLNGKANDQKLLDFLGEAKADPPATGVFQKTLADERKLLFPAVPDYTVMNTRDRTMWLTFYPGDTQCKVAGGGISDGPSTKQYIGRYWESPNLDEAKALIEGWTGASPNQWLIEKTKAVAPDNPTSRGFANIVDAGCGDAAIWIRLPKTPPDYVYPTLNLRNGTIINIEKFGNYRWLFLERQLTAGEQYYWYPGQ